MGFIDKKKQTVRLHVIFHVQFFFLVSKGDYLKQMLEFPGHRPKDIEECLSAVLSLFA